MGIGQRAERGGRLGHGGVYPQDNSTGPTSAPATSVNPDPVNFSDGVERLVASVPATVSGIGKALWFVEAPYEFNGGSSSQVTFIMKIGMTIIDTVTIDLQPDGTRAGNYFGNFSWHGTPSVAPGTSSFSVGVQGGGVEFLAVGFIPAGEGRVSVLPF